MELLNRVVYQVRFGSAFYNGLPVACIYNVEETDTRRIFDFDFETAYELFLEKKNELSNVVLTQTPYLCRDDWNEFWEDLGCDVPDYPEVVVLLKA